MEYEQILLETHDSRAEDIVVWLTDQEISFQQMDEFTLEAPPKGRVRFRIFIKPEMAEPILQEIRQTFSALDFTIEQKRRDESEWQDAWKDFFRIRKIDQFVIVPSWEERNYEPQKEEFPLFLDPGRAFGTGGHESTRLCLQLLSQIEIDKEVSEVLDVGCGSGILLIAALKKYPKAQGWGIDIEKDAVEVTLENAAHNDVHERTLASMTLLFQIGKTFDLVFANLTGPVIIELARHLARVLRKEGLLLVSGIVQYEVQSVQAALEQQGLVVEDKKIEGEWVGLLVKPRSL